MTRKKWEQQVIEYVHDCGGHCSYFFLTDNRFRACALDRLIKRGRLHVKVMQFPVWEITERFNNETQRF